ATAADRANAWLTSLAAVTVVLMAVIGFHGILHTAIEKSRYEYALLTALGAGPRTVRRMVYFRAGFLVLPGLLIAVPVSLIFMTWFAQTLELVLIRPEVAVCVALVSLAAL